MNVPSKHRRPYDKTRGPRSLLLYHGEAVPADRVLRYDARACGFAFTACALKCIVLAARGLPEVGTVDWSLPSVTSWGGGLHLVTATAREPHRNPAGFDSVAVGVVYGRLPGPVTVEEYGEWVRAISSRDVMLAAVQLLSAVEFCVDRAFYNRACAVLAGTAYSGASGELARYVTAPDAPIPPAELLICALIDLAGAPRDRPWALVIAASTCMQLMCAYTAQTGREIGGALYAHKKLREWAGGPVVTGAYIRPRRLKTDQPRGCA